MRATTVEHISSLQETPKNIRNICILAHVDHGKTTLADALVASNGIISSRLAGKLRYMDSREDEQIRGITMKASAISLHYAKDNKEFLINLIDSPGHVDFSSEVSTAVRLCDGAIVVVDAVEGVSPQTQVVLRQAWLENIRPCLVVNKIDRLITELKYSPLEAHLHLQQILEQVNAITGKLFSSEVMEKSSSKVDNSAVKRDNLINDDTAVSIEHWSSGLDEVDDSTLYFSPDLGNVVFASAIDGWGFSINDFAVIYAKKLGLNADILRKTLWGDFYLDPKSKRIFKKAHSKGKKPLFVQFILQNIWSIYDAVVVRRDKLKTDQIVKSLNLKISARDSRSTDSRVQLHAILGQWLPLSSVVLSMVVDKLPSPLEMEGERVEKLLCSGLRTFESLPQDTKNLKQAFLSCTSTEEAPLIVFVSKMFAVDDNSLPKHKNGKDAIIVPLTQEEITERRERAREKHAQMLLNSTRKAETNEDETCSVSTTDLVPEKKNEESSTPATHFMAFARVYSGTIRKGQRLYVLGPRHDPRNISDEEKNARCSDYDSSEIMNTDSKAEGLAVAKSVDLGNNQTIAVFTVDDLYLLMGRELEALDSVPAGNVLGIGGLQNHVLKSATIANTIMCPPFTALHIEARPIVRVAVEPIHYADLPALSRGMRLLNQADPCVETFMARTGEHVIVAAGEVHLQKCVDDLKERFACVPFCVSEPIIPFRETLIRPPKMDMVNEAIAGNVVAHPSKPDTNYDGAKTPGNKDKTLVEIVTANKRCSIHIRAIPLTEQITQLLDTNTETIKLLVGTEKKQLGSQINSQSKDDIKGLYCKLKELFDEAGAEWKDAVDNIWAFGPARTGPNLLLNRIPDYNRPSVWLVSDRENRISDSGYRSYDNSILSGFQLATLAGPLCEEPLMGVCFVIENIIMDQQEESRNNLFSNTCKTGQTGSSSSFTEENRTTKGENETLARNCISGTAEEEDGLLVQNMSDKEFSTEIQSTKAPPTSREAEKKINNPEGINGEELRKDEKRTENSGEEIVMEDTQTTNEFTDATNSDKENSMDHEVSPQDEKACKGSAFDRFGPFSGQLMSAVKEGCRRAYQLQPMRLVAAMYTCHIQATAEVLGRMYAVIAKREGRVLSETMMEGSDVFDVEAVLPVAESFGFSEQIRKRTSGLANPQLVFSHWEVIDIDPYWVPTTEEEYTHFGAKADSENQARKYMNIVRRRKGLYVDEKTVEHAEKQRTLKK